MSEKRYINVVSELMQVYKDSITDIINTNTNKLSIKWENDILLKNNVEMIYYQSKFNNLNVEQRLENFNGYIGYIDLHFKRSYETDFNLLFEKIIEENKNSFVEITRRELNEIRDFFLSGCKDEYINIVNCSDLNEYYDNSSTRNEDCDFNDEVFNNLLNSYIYLNEYDARIIFDIYESHLTALNWEKRGITMDYCIETLDLNSFKENLHEYCRIDTETTAGDYSEPDNEDNEALS